jgi:hypothetical protein
MFQQKVFCKRLPIRPRSIRVDPGTIGSVGTAHWPERMLTTVPACRETIPCVAFFGEAHRSSKLSGWLLKQSPPESSRQRLEARRTYGEFSKLNTPELAQVPPAIWQEFLRRLRCLATVGCEPCSRTLGKTQGAKNQEWRTSDSLP